jgi:membrane protein required for beta-lactamase induction
VSGREIAGAVVGLAVLLALAAGVIDHRHRKRDNLDRVSLLDWRNVQVFALIAALIGLALALHL